jgi:hypothetical protein
LGRFNRRYFALHRYELVTIVMKARIYHFKMSHGSDWYACCLEKKPQTLIGTRQWCFKIQNL